MTIPKIVTLWKYGNSIFKNDKKKNTKNGNKSIKLPSYLNILKCDVKLGIKIIWIQLIVWMIKNKFDNHIFLFLFSNSVYNNSII